MKITFKQQLWISFGIVLVAFLAAGIALYFLSGAITTQVDKIIVDNTLIARQTAAVSILADLKRDAPQAAMYADAFKKLLPTHDALIGFQGWINTEAQTHNVSLSFNFQGGNTPATPTTLGIDVFNITATGASSDLIAFLNDLEARAPGFLLSIDSFDIVTNSPGYRLTARGDYSLNNMKGLLRKHPDTILIVLAIIFLTTVISYFVWGMGQVVGEVDRGLNTTAGGANSVNFDLKGAASLDLRGLVKASP